MSARWLVFANFLSDMGLRPPGKTLDRIDNSKGYEPGNCRWATRTEQQRNRGNMLLEFGGKVQSLPDWADEVGIDCNTIRNRVKRLGWSVERALTSPLVKGANQWSKGGA
jgi:hypothetical protein